MSQALKELQEKAFLFYLTLGEDRTLDKVAENFGVRPARVRQWSSNHKWADRIKKESDKAIEKAKKEARKLFVQDKQQMLMAKNMIVASMVNDIKELDQVPIKDKFTVYKTLKIELGEPVNITQELGTPPEKNPILQQFNVLLQNISNEKEKD